MGQEGLEYLGWHHISGTGMNSFDSFPVLSTPHYAPIVLGIRWNYCPPSTWNDWDFNFGWTILSWTSLETFLCIGCARPKEIKTPFAHIFDISSSYKKKERKKKLPKQNAPLRGVTDNFLSLAADNYKEHGEGKIIETLSHLMVLGHRQLGSHFCKSVTQFSSPFTTQRSGAGSHVSIVCGKCRRQKVIVFCELKQNASYGDGGRETGT